MDTKMAAIALTLIVAIPIMLGYALALEEEEITGWETTESVNITDMMTNSTNNIYVPSRAPANNANLYASIYYPGSGVTETSIQAPNYVSTSSTYSSLPIYTTSTSTFDLTHYTQATTEGTDMGSYTQYGTLSYGSHPYIYITTDQLAQCYVSDGTSALGTAFGPFVDVGGQWYGENVGDLKYTTSIRVVSDQHPTYTITTRVYTTVPDDAGQYYSFTLPQWSAIKINQSGGTSYYTPGSSATVAVVRSGTTLLVDGNAYGNVSSVEIAPSASVGNSITYTKLTASGSYADPSYGWDTNLSPGNAVTPYWLNGSVNNSIRMMIAIDDGEQSTLRVIDSDNNQSSGVTITKSSGTVSVGGTALGQYGYLCADISGSSITVSGIPAWPNMYAAPQIINSVTVDMATTVDDFVRVRLNDTHNIEYRVDSAEVLSGTFGTIENYTLTMSDLWPSDSYSVALTSAGIYGSSITFAGDTYTVTDGQITVNGSSIAVRNAVFSSIYDSDSSTWSNQLNGVELSTSATPSTIVFGGEWSMTVAAYKMHEVTSSELVWHAGEFAFNGVDNNFALMGLLTCVAVLIGLGMYGRRSGAKVGTLMIICGCAAFVFLALM